MSFKSLFVALIVASLASRAAAADPPTTAPSPFSLTIYSAPDDSVYVQSSYNQFGDLVDSRTAAGFAVVRQTRAINLTSGENTIRFTDVASGIDPTTVSFRSLTAPDTTNVLEQNYEYDLLSGDKLFQKYLGKNVTVHLDHGEAANATSSISGNLLSFDANSLVVGTAKSVEVIARSTVTQVSLADMDSDLIVKPTLVWKIQAAQAGEHQAQVTYQTNNIGWRADYTLALNKDQTAADISSWVTITNESGLSYPDANIKLVAGNVRRLGNQSRENDYAVSAGAGFQAPQQQFQEQSFSDYHLYTLQRTSSVADNAKKQIELFSPRANIPVTKSYSYDALRGDFSDIDATRPYTEPLRVAINKQIDLFIHLDNSEKNGMGIPLPAGHARVYLRDPADATLEFIGEDTIGHTPKDEKVNLRIGTAFDIVGDHRQTDFTNKSGDKEIDESFEITLKNHKPDPVDVTAVDYLFRWTNWEITQSSDKFDKVDSRTIHFPVTVPANGEKTITYTVRYFW